MFSYPKTYPSCPQFDHSHLLAWDVIWAKYTFQKPMTSIYYACVLRSTYTAKNVRNPKNQLKKAQNQVDLSEFNRFHFRFRHLS